MHQHQPTAIHFISLHFIKRGKNKTTEKKTREKKINIFTHFIYRNWKIYWKHSFIPTCMYDNSNTPFSRVCVPPLLKLSTDTNGKLYRVLLSKKNVNCELAWHLYWLSFPFYSSDSRSVAKILSEFVTIAKVLGISISRKIHSFQNQIQFTLYTTPTF